MAKNCPECKTLPIEIKACNHEVILDFQADLWKKERKNLNLHQVVNKIVEEWKEMKK